MILLEPTKQPESNETTLGALGPKGTKDDTPHMTLGLDLMV